MIIKLVDKDGLGKKLKQLSSVDFKKVAMKSLTEMFNRAEQPPWTPVDTGELRQSRAVSRPVDGFDGEFGYSKEYAPHVEYGHRTRGNGFVEGQRFLKKNVELQRPIFESDVSSYLKGKVSK